ncbi:hypothetical protein ONE63_004810 [Megalurothrips usitatus]|uniref:Uncharacterized protein n=1 Tax=Megalurothrips usitatus TaxID=439358 RepID=A0AAV7X470_9NEOP|nr:hypothetical protein ONE63_004810 [Megalurothrips usitatus]
MTLDKRAAIAAEDFGRARTLKTTVDQLRERLYKELAVDDLLEKDGPVAKNDESPEDEAVDGGAPLKADLLREAMPAVTPEPGPRTAPASPLHCGLHRSTATPSPTPTTPARR